MAIKPCTNGARHKWEFVKNVSVTTYASQHPHGAAYRAKLKGVYRCACGETKYGLFNHNGADLRNL